MQDNGGIGPMGKKDLKLTIELIPRPLWFFSLYNLYKQQKQLSKWNKMKKRLFEKEGRRCWICGEENVRLEAHEFWEYDDHKHVQKLVAIHHLCAMCHRIKHIGFWCSTDEGLQRMDQMGLTENDLIKHFCNVNTCSRKEFEEHHEQSTMIWKERSEFDWKQDLGEYAPDTQARQVEPV
jgi:hypothetical protein